MNNKDIIVTKSGNKYIYSPFLKTLSCLFPDKDCEYAKQKIEYLEKHLFFKEEEVNFKTKLDKSFLENSLENLSHLLLEVTDGCNLACKYCGYGELYGNYDKRFNKMASFENIKALIDYLTNFWKKKNTNLFTVTIGFYGGEPLLNFELIKSCVKYLEDITLTTGIRFRYNMTTNSMLLNRYMDFLCEHSFNLLLSLDGNQFNDSYRLLKSGKESFSSVYSNIKEFQKKYPSYFEENVNFNAVLHNRNSIQEITTFIYKEFGKKPLISELSTIGIRPDKIDEFRRMFNSKLDERNTCDEVLQDFDMDPYKNMLNAFMTGFLDINYNMLYEFFLDKEKCIFLPTGTCRPLERKLFLTVNGKLLNCERVGQDYVLGSVSGGKVSINLENIANIYTRLYESVVKLCNQCANKLNCGQCLFRMSLNKQGNVSCGSFLSVQARQGYLTQNIELLEQYPEKYKQIIKEMVVV